MHHASRPRAPHLDLLVPLLVPLLAPIFAACSPVPTSQEDVGALADADDCELLEACCEALGGAIPGSVLAACEGAVAEGGAACSVALGSLMGQGECTEQVATGVSARASRRGSSRPGASASASTVEASLASRAFSATSSASTTPGESSRRESSRAESTGRMTSTSTSTSAGTSTSASTSTSTGTGTSTSTSASTSASAIPAAPTCANPPSTVPVGFLPPTGILGSACSPAETTVIGACVLGADAGGEEACEDAVTSDGGAANGCYQCLYTQVPAVGNGPALWGAYLQLGLEPAVGDVDGEFVFNLGYNLGGCIYGASPSGHACGLDVMQLQACQFAVCLPLCAVPDPGAGEPVSQAALDALNACFTAAEGGACSAYTTAAETDCVPLVGEGGVFDACEALIAEDDGSPDAGAPTAASESALIGLVCGGADAGF